VSVGVDILPSLTGLVALECVRARCAANDGGVGRVNLRLGAWAGGGVEGGVKRATVFASISALSDAGGGGCSSGLAR
jgi:hypothetical protein